jgi:hypothetical protein
MIRVLFPYGSVSGQANVTLDQHLCNTFTSWRTVPLLVSSCLVLRGALDRDAQQPFCYASAVLCLRCHTDQVMKGGKTKGHI